MSFLHNINNQNGIENRAIRELYKARAMEKLSLLQPESKNNDHTKEDQVKSFITAHKKDQTDLPNSPTIKKHNNKTELFLNKWASNSSKNKCTEFNLTSCAVEGSDKKASVRSEKEKQHASFSNYLLKTKQQQVGKSHPRIQVNLKYFDLDQISNHLASPKKLENKIEIKSSTTHNKKNKVLDLRKCQFFLKNLEKDKIRYHQNERQFQERIKSNSHIDFHSALKNRKNNLRATSLWRQKMHSQSKPYDNIVPWLQNEEVNSPLIMKRGHSALDAMISTDPQFQQTTQ